jgi:hypothetical protein
VLLQRVAQINLQNIAHVGSISKLVCMLEEQGLPKNKLKKLKALN